MEKEQLDAIKERVANATPGEWIIDNSSDDRPYITDIWFDGEENGHVEIHRYGAAAESYDAEFIAHARQDVSALIAEVERLRDEQEATEDLFRRTDEELGYAQEEIERQAAYAIAESRRLQALEGLSPILKTLVEGKAIFGQASARISFGEYDLVLEMLDPGEQSSNVILDEIFDWAEGLGLKDVVEKLESYANKNGGENDV